MCKTTSLGILAGIGLVLASGGAHALLISPTGNSLGNPPHVTYQVTIDSTDVGQRFAFDWLVPKGTVGDAPLPIDLTAHGDFTITGFALDANGDDTLSLQIALSNTTDLSAYPSSNSAILAFGFGVAPDAKAAFSQMGTVFDGIGTGSGPQQTFAGGFKQIDICIYAANGCKGGDVNDGLQAGDSDLLTINIFGDFDQGGSSQGTVALYDFPLKFQGTWGSFETGGRHQVPEPGILALFGSALLGLGLRRTRRRR